MTITFISELFLNSSGEDKIPISNKHSNQSNSKLIDIEKSVICNEKENSSNSENNIVPLSLRADGSTFNGLSINTVNPGHTKNFLFKNGRTSNNNSSAVNNQSDSVSNASRSKNNQIIKENKELLNSSGRAETTCSSMFADKPQGEIEKKHANKNLTHMTSPSDRIAYSKSLKALNSLPKEMCNLGTSKKDLLQNKDNSINTTNNSGVQIENDLGKSFFKKTPISSPSCVLEENSSYSIKNMNVNNLSHISNNCDQFFGGNITKDGFKSQHFSFNQAIFGNHNQKFLDMRKVNDDFEKGILKLKKPRIVLKRLSLKCKSYRIKKIAIRKKIPNQNSLLTTKGNVSDSAVQVSCNKPVIDPNSLRDDIKVIKESEVKTAKESIVETAKENKVETTKESIHFSQNSKSPIPVLDKSPKTNATQKQVVNGSIKQSLATKNVKIDTNSSKSPSNESEIKNSSCESVRTKDNSSKIKCVDISEESPKKNVVQCQDNQTVKQSPKVDSQKNDDDIIFIKSTLSPSKKLNSKTSATPNVDPVKKKVFDLSKQTPKQNLSQSQDLIDKSKSNTFGKVAHCSKSLLNETSNTSPEKHTKSSIKRKMSPNKSKNMEPKAKVAKTNKNLSNTKKFSVKKPEISQKPISKARKMSSPPVAVVKGKPAPKQKSESRDTPSEKKYGKKDADSLINPNLFSRFVKLGGEIAQSINQALMRNKQSILDSSASSLEKRFHGLLNILTLKGDKEFDAEEMDRILKWLEEEEMEKILYKKRLLECLKASHATNLTLYSEMVKAFNSD